MKKLFSALAICLIPAFASAKSLDLGASFPKLSDKISKMEGVDGKIYTIDAVKKPAGTLVIFSCNHCPYAVKWEERIRDIGNKYSKTWVDVQTKSEYPPLGVIMINSNDPTDNPIDGMAEMKNRSDTLGLQFPYVVDATSQIAKAYGATKTPEIFLFDKDGKLVYKGAVDDNYDASKMKDPYLIKAIEAMIKGEEIKLKETKAIGCSIKFRS